MKEVKVKLYKFNELSDEVRKSIVDKIRWDVGYGVMESRDCEIDDTLKKFSEIFGISVQYEVCYSNCRFSFAFDDEAVFWNNYDFSTWLSADDVKGKYLLRYLNTKYYDILSRNYYSTGHHYDGNNKFHYKCRRSRIMWNEGSCPLTGVIFDCEILKDIWDWFKRPDWNMSLRDLIGTCLTHFFEMWQKEYEYWCDNDEAIEEELNVNWYENSYFYADGTEFKGIYEDAA